MDAASNAAMDLETGFIILGFKDVFRHYRLLPIVPDIVVDGHNVLGRPLTGTRIVPMFVRPYTFYDANPNLLSDILGIFHGT